jgi:predicted glycosyltransferase
MTVARSVYYPVESTIGLGHFKRAGEIVKRMAALGLDVTVASGSFVDEARFFPGVRRKILPRMVRPKVNGSFVVLDRDGRGVTAHDFIRQDWQDERARAHIKHFRLSGAQTLITEFWPFGRPSLHYEYNQLIQASRQVPRDVRRIVSVRDVTTYEAAASSDQEVSLSEEEQANIVERLNRDFDVVLVHGDPSFMRLSDTFPMADRIKTDVVYTGYVLEAVPARSPQAADGPVLVSCGSGGGCHDFVFHFLSAWERAYARRASDPRAQRLTRHPLHIVSGPRFQTWAWNDLTHWVERLRADYGHDVVLRRYAPDLTEAFANAAFSVSTAGYNTTLELMAINTPALLAPKYAMSQGELVIEDEQVVRLKRLEQRGLVAMITPEESMDSRRFADRLLDSYDQQMRETLPRPRLDLAGSEKTAATVKALCPEERKRNWFVERASWLAACLHG